MVKTGKYTMLERDYAGGDDADADDDGNESDTPVPDSVLVPPVRGECAFEMLLCALHSISPIQSWSARVSLVTLHL